MPNGPLRITGLPFDVAQYESEKKVEDEEILVSLTIFFSDFKLWFLENLGSVDQQEDQEA